MCRNIRQLHNFEPPATTDEVRAAALQYVRKVSGSTKPSQANQAAFDEAVEEIAQVTQHLLDHLVTNAPPKDREVEAAKAKERARAATSAPAESSRDPCDRAGRPAIRGLRDRPRCVVERVVVCGWWTG